MGYASASTGPALQALATLTSFGLLERRGKGEVGVTDLAMRILFPDSADELAEALREAALSPPVFSQIAERFPDGVPNPNGIITFLRRIDFTEKAAKIAASTYVTSISFAQSLRDNERSDTSAPEQETLTQRSASEPTPGEETRVLSQAEFKDWVRFQVGGDSIVRIMTNSGNPTAKQAKALVTMLQAQVALLDEDADGPIEEAAFEEAVAS